MTGIRNQFQFLDADPDPQNDVDPDPEDDANLRFELKQTYFFLLSKKANYAIFSFNNFLKKRISPMIYWLFTDWQKSAEDLS